LDKRKINKKSNLLCRTLTSLSIEAIMPDGHRQFHIVFRLKLLRHCR
jgi:hypothetical protein